MAEKKKTKSTSTKKAENTEAAQASTPKSTPVRKEGGGGGIGKALLVILLGIIAGLGYLYFTYDPAPTDEKTGDELSTADIMFEGEEGDGPVAMVNGTPIARGEYETNVLTIAENARAQGADLSDETLRAEIKKQALSNLIDTALLLQSATAANISVDDDAVNAQFDSVASEFGGKDTLLAQVASYRVTEDSLRSDIRDQLIIDAFLKQQVADATLEITEEEIEDFYGTLENGTDTPPELDSVRSQIEAQLRLQKEQAFVQKLIEELRSEAEIETLV